MSEENTESKVLPTIVTRKRYGDWIAYIAGQSGKWECAKTEEEAIGKLHISHSDILGTIHREEK